MQLILYSNPMFLTNFCMLCQFSLDTWRKVKSTLLQRVLHRASRRGFTPYYYDLEILAEKAQYDFFRFRHSCRKGYCLNCLHMVKPRPSGASLCHAAKTSWSRLWIFASCEVWFQQTKRHCSFPFSLLCDFILFYCHCAVSFSNVCATVKCNKRSLTYLLIYLLLCFRHQQ